MSEQSGGVAAPAGESAAPVEPSTEAVQSQEQSASGEPSAADLQDAVENGELSQAEANKLIKKFSLKVRGKVVEREVNLGDEEYLRNQFQLAEVAKQEMQSGAELKKAYQKEMERFRANPWEVLQELGLDPDALAEERITRRIEEMKKSPEQLEKEQYQRELEEARAESKKLKEEKEMIESQKLQEQAAIQINEEIDKALDGHKSLPNSPMVRKRIADTMLWAMNNGHPDVTAEDVVPLVSREMREELNSLYDQLPEDALEEFIGRKNIERMRTKRLAKAKPVSNLNDVKPTAASVKQAQELQAKQNRERISAKDFFRNKK